VSKKGFILLIIPIFLLFFFLTFWGDKGIFHLIRLKNELSRIKENNLKIEAENQRLREEVRRLKYEKRYIEEIARKELGMIKDGEIIYQFDLSEDKKGGK
jgi:cell division protein FtsB